MADLLAAVVERHGRGGLRAVLEAPTPNALNGKFSWFGCGFAFGVWSGALRAHGVQARLPGDSLLGRVHDEVPWPLPANHAWSLPKHWTLAHFPELGFTTYVGCV